MVGFFAIDRNIYSSLTKEQRSAFAWLCFKAAWAPYTTTFFEETITLQPGEIITTCRHLEREWGWGHERVARFLSTLEKRKVISRTTSQDGYLVLKLADRPAHPVAHPSASAQRNDGAETAHPHPQSEPVNMRVEQRFKNGPAHPQRTDGAESARAPAHPSAHFKNKIIHKKIKKEEELGEERSVASAPSDPLPISLPLPLIETTSPLPNLRAPQAKAQGDFATPARLPYPRGTDSPVLLSDEDIEHLVFKVFDTGRKPRLDYWVVALQNFAANSPKKFKQYQDHRRVIETWDRRMLESGKTWSMSAGPQPGFYPQWLVERQISGIGVD